MEHNQIETLLVCPTGAPSRVPGGLSRLLIASSNRARSLTMPATSVAVSNLQAGKQVLTCWD